MTFEHGVELVATGIDGVGVVVIVGGMAVATALVFRRGEREWFRSYRQDVGRAILLGLEFLVAADIIRTIAVTPTFRGVGVLAVIVLIRTFLSITLELELEGRWPWQRARDARSPDGR